MKNKLLIFTILFTSILIGQNKSEKSLEENKQDKQFVFGATTGINFNNFGRPGSALGYQLGGTVKYDMQKFYSFSSGISYSIIGGQSTDRVVNSAIPNSLIIRRDFLNRSINLHSVEIPLKVILTHPKTKKSNIHPELSLGLVYNAVMYANEKRDELWYSSNKNFKGEPIKTMINYRNDNVTSSFNNHLFSFILGTAINIPVTNKTSYTLGANYKFGLQNIKSTPLPYAENMRTNQFNITFGVNFN